jgi:tetratricopeptide (TPR) repeat protein
LLQVAVLGALAGCGAGVEDSPQPQQANVGTNDGVAADDHDDNDHLPAGQEDTISERLKRFEAELNREGHLHSICHEALELAEEALQEDPDLAVAYAVRAHVRAEHGETKEALQDYKKAFELDRDNVVYGQKLAVSYETNEQLDEALDVWKDLCRRFPDEWRNFFGRGSIYDQLGREEKAQADYERALRLQQHR